MAMDIVKNNMSLEKVQQSRAISLKETRNAPARQITAAGGNNTPEAKQDHVAIEGSKATNAVIKLNSFIQSVGRDLLFSVDDDSGEMVIKVVDSETKELIRQIPPEEVVALSEYLEQVSEITSTGFKQKA